MYFPHAKMKLKPSMYKGYFFDRLGMSERRQHDQVQRRDA